MTVDQRITNPARAGRINESIRMTCRGNGKQTANEYRRKADTKSCIKITIDH